MATIPEDFARSVVRIPVAGPAPNNTLVYIRAQFPSNARPITGSIDRYTLFTVTPYQIAGFDQARYHEYVEHTRVSVSGWLNYVNSIGPQKVTFAVDELWGGVTEDGHIAIKGHVAGSADEFKTINDFWLSAYVLTQEPEQDFSRPPVDWSAVRAQALPRGSKISDRLNVKLSNK
ncbi:MAG: hypothetical protein QOE74_1417 [Mycobacterium sp.]|jgi:hypothetical protein|nr:hypothetical protein [Mycobacterium sp.]